MREIRTSGSEGGGAGHSTGPSYPYPALLTLLDAPNPTEHVLYVAARLGQAAVSRVP